MKIPELSWPVLAAVYALELEATRGSRAIQATVVPRTKGHPMLHRHPVALVTRALSCCLLLIVGLSAVAAHGAEDWLSEPEREFFAAMGVDAKVNGAAVKRKADLTAWPEIARRAPPPLSGQIHAIAAAYDRMSPTAAEREKLETLQARLQTAIQGELRSVVAGALFGRDSFDQARDSTGRIMQVGDDNGPYVRQAWDLQKSWLLRGLEARDTADKNMRLITDALQRRVGKKLSDKDSSWSLLALNQSLTLSGQVSSMPLRSPVVQLVLHRNSTEGAWTGLNALSSGLGLSLGISDQMDALKGTELSVAQERAMNLPFVTTFVLPDLAASSRVGVQVDLPLEATLGIERAELFAWTDQGTLHVEELAGLDTARRRAEKMIDEQRAKSQPQTGPLQSMLQPPGPQGDSKASQQPKPKTREEARALARKKAERDRLAAHSLNLARGAIARKDDHWAKIYLKQTIDVAPDSAAAKTAQLLMRKFENDK